MLDRSWQVKDINFLNNLSMAGLMELLVHAFGQHLVASDLEKRKGLKEPKKDDDYLWEWVSHILQGFENKLVLEWVYYRKQFSQNN